MLIYLSNQLVSLSTGVHSVESTRFCLDKQIVAFNAFEWKGGCKLEDHLEQSAILIEDLWIYKLSKWRACEWHCKCLPDALKPNASLHQTFDWQARSVCGQEAWDSQVEKIDRGALVSSEVSLFGTNSINQKRLSNPFWRWRMVAGTAFWCLVIEQLNLSS